MIRVSEHPQKRFNISNKFALYQKQLNSNKHGKNSTDHAFEHIDNEYNAYIVQLKKQLDDFQRQYDEEQASENPDVSKIETLNIAIEKQLIKINDLENLSKSSLHNKSLDIQNVKYAAKTIRLGFLYKIDQFWMKSLIVLVLGAIVSVCVWLLVQYTGVYTAGISGIIQGIAKITKIKIEELGESYINLSNLIYNALFWGLYFVINIPLVIFAYFKIGKQFAILSAIYIAVSQGVGFGLGFINNGQGIFVFTNMNPNIVVSSNFIEGVQMLPWNMGEGLVFGIFVYATVYAAISGFMFSALYILGSSTGGTDFIGFYYSKVRNKSIGNMLTIFNIVSLFIGVTLGSFVCWILKAVNNENIILNGTTILEAFFSPNLVASIAGAILAGVIYNYYFPRNKVIKVQIYSAHASEIAIALTASDWNYKLLLTKDRDNVLSNQDINHSLETICFYIDIPALISTIRSIDTEGLITIYSTFGFDGELPTSSYEK